MEVTEKMRFQIDDELDVYEAFMKYGLGDGDHPLASMVLGEVYSLLDELGYRYETASCIHNNGFISKIVTPAGRTIEMNSLESEPHYLRRQLPKDLVQALDRLNQTTYTSPLL